MLDIFKLSPAFDLSWELWAFAFLAAFGVGLSKSGIKGITIVFVTVLALVFGGKTSTGVLLPMLMVGDAFAIWYYNRHAEWRYLRHLMPWMVVGVLIGVWVGKDLPEEIFKQGMAVIILVSVIIMFWWEKRTSRYVPDNWWFGGILGLVSGFTTMVGNLAGAYTTIFFLAMRLPKNAFIGTAAWLYFFINLFKLPFHIFVWETVTVETISLNLRLFPAILLGLFFGVRLVKLIKEKPYRNLILILTALGAIMIFFR